MGLEIQTFKKNLQIPLVVFPLVVFAFFFPASVSFLAPAASPAVRFHAPRRSASWPLPSSAAICPSRPGFRWFHGTTAPEVLEMVVHIRDQLYINTNQNIRLGIMPCIYSQSAISSPTNKVENTLLSLLFNEWDDVPSSRCATLRTSPVAEILKKTPSYETPPSGHMRLRHMRQKQIVRDSPD